MSIDVPVGKYVLAVSGGVDSMVLFDVLRKKAGVELVVAHFDHGIREDSEADAQLVRSVAMSHNITFELGHGELGPEASEEKARNARYKFLRHIGKKHNAAAIMTAHHQDDLLETAVVNLLRGTGWRGLCSLRSSIDVVRPLLHIPKSEIRDYAVQKHILWHEDTTNTDQKYLRNYVRHTIIASAGDAWRQRMLKYIVRQNELANAIEDAALQWFQTHSIEIGNTTSLPRYQLVMLPDNVAHELLQMTLRHRSGKSIERPLANRALLFCKVAKAGKAFQCSAAWQLRATRKDIIVEPTPGVVS